MAIIEHRQPDDQSDRGILSPQKRSNDAHWPSALGLKPAIIDTDFDVRFLWILRRALTAAAQTRPVTHGDTLPLYHRIYART
jgi:hypothetical protein